MCRLDSGSHFDSASVVKVTILGTPLRDAQAAHRSLTRRERSLAWAMITRSGVPPSQETPDETVPAGAG